MSYSSKVEIKIMGTTSPFVCPVCEFVLRDLDDVISVKTHSACRVCTDSFKFPNLEKWKNGWRPTVEEARTH